MLLALQRCYGNSPVEAEELLIAIETVDGYSPYQDDEECLISFYS